MSVLPPSLKKLKFARSVWLGPGSLAESNRSLLALPSSYPMLPVQLKISTYWPAAPTRLLKARALPGAAKLITIWLAGDVAANVRAPIPAEPPDPVGPVGTTPSVSPPVLKVAPPFKLIAALLLMRSFPLAPLKANVAPLATVTLEVPPSACVAPAANVPELTVVAPL